MDDIQLDIEGVISDIEATVVGSADVVTLRRVQDHIDRQKRALELARIHVLDPDAQVEIAEIMGDG